MYWTFSAFLSVLQQMIIMRRLGVPIHLFGETESQEEKAEKDEDEENLESDASEPELAKPISKPKPKKNTKTGKKRNKSI